MDRLESRRDKDITNGDLYSVLNDYVKKTIMKDLDRMYENKIEPLDSEDPWIFEAKK